VTKYLTLEQVLIIHKQMVNKYGGTHGIRNKNLLESAVIRPQMSVFGEDAYRDLYFKSAALFHSLIKNHPFLDGNKRTAFASMHMMLLVNGYDLTSTFEEEVTMALDVSVDKMSLEKIASWLKKHTKEFKG